MGSAGFPCFCKMKPERPAGTQARLTYKSVTSIIAIKLGCRICRNSLARIILSFQALLEKGRNYLVSSGLFPQTTSPLSNRVAAYVNGRAPEKANEEKSRLYRSQNPAIATDRRTALRAKYLSRAKCCQYS